MRSFDEVREPVPISVASICRHEKGDPACSSSPAGQAREREYRAQRDAEELSRLRRELADASSPKVDDFEVLDAEAIGAHLVLRVKYPNCKKCSYEGEKVMVILDATMKDALGWRLLDPHFRDPERPRERREAPSPTARFPASDEGWADAIEYAKMKVGQKSWGR